MSATTRILVIANLPPWVLGGAENQVARLVETWVVLGHRVEVAGHRIPTGTAMLGRAEVPTHRIPVLDRLGRPGRALSYLLALAWLLQRIGGRFDVIYSRGLGDGAISICLLKSLGWTRLPLVACPINARGTGDVHFIRSIPGWRWIARWIDHHCDAINIIAPAIEEDLVALGIRRPSLSRIPNGIPIAPAIKRASVAPVRRLVWTGRLSRQKGLDLLLLALASAAAGGQSFRLEIIGGGPELAALTAQCHHLGLERQVVFTPATGCKGVRESLAAADVFVLPSRYEGMSNAGLEAMEAGLPLLITRCGGLDTYIDARTGWLCDPEDKEGLTEALLAMLTTRDTDLLAMGHLARDQVERMFDMAIIGQRNAELLSAVARRTDPAGV